MRDGEGGAPRETERVKEGEHRERQRKRGRQTDRKKPEIERLRREGWRREALRDSEKQKVINIRSFLYYLFVGSVKMICVFPTTS